MGDEKTIPLLVFARHHKPPSSTPQISGFGCAHAPETRFTGGSRFQQRPAEPTDRLRLDLTYSFPRDAELTTQFLERARALPVESEPGSDYPPFAGTKCVEQTYEFVVLDVPQGLTLRVHCLGVGCSPEQGR